MNIDGFNFVGVYVNKPKLCKTTQSFHCFSFGMKLTKLHKILCFQQGLSIHRETLFSGLALLSTFFSHVGMEPSPPGY